MRFLGKVLRKRSQTREDRVVTDDLFADAILAHFDQDEEAAIAEGRLDRAIGTAKLVNKDLITDLPDGTPLPGREDQERLEKLRAELDLSPASLRETLETAMAVEAGRPRLKDDGRGRDRLVHPVPPLWQELVDHTLKDDGPRGSMLALVFDPAHYVRDLGGRPVYTPEPDSRLLHLGDALYHRVMSTFARYRFPGGPAAATRWTVREGPVPEGCDALVLLTVEELAVNELREPCHHWVRTLALPITDGELGAPLPHAPGAAWAAAPALGDRDDADEVWQDAQGPLRKRVREQATQLTAELTARLKEAGRVVRGVEKTRFKRRRKELERAIGENQLARLAKEAEKLRVKARQLALFSEIDLELQKQLADLDAELSLRKGHYEQVQLRLVDEERRTLELVIPPRYRLRGQARVYPIAVEIRLPGGEA